MFSVSAVRLGRLGDLVMTLPSLVWLESSDEINLSLICDSSYEGLFSHLLPSTRVVAAGRHSDLDRADLILDLHRVNSSLRLRTGLARTPGAPTVKVHKQTLLRSTLLRRPPWLRAPQRVVAAALGGPSKLLSWPERHLLATEQVFSRLGVSPPPRPLPVPTVGLVEGLHQGAAPVSTPVLGMVLDAGWELKRWSRESFCELALRWHSSCGGALRFFAAPSEAGLLEGLSALPLSSCHSSSTVLGLARDLAQCDVVVAGDTGPLHLAGALGCSLVGLFGPTPTNSGFWVWEEQGELLTAPQWCSPCSMHGSTQCRRSIKHCLEDISVDDVLAATLQILGKNRRCA
jgi:ADP-heptose:LPS heptosyltransferase